MNENILNDNLETDVEQVKDPIYSSEYLINKELFYDFSSVGYSRIKKMFLVFLCIISFETVLGVLNGGDYIAGSCLFVSLLLLMSYLRMKKSIKINYERNLISAGGEYALKYELYEDKIVSYADEVKREYSYLQVTGLRETKYFILLHLKHQLYITINKNALNAGADEVKSFLIEKCALVKKKKFINCSNDKKWALRFLIAVTTVSVVGACAIFGISLFHNKPMHFKGLDYSTTRSDIQKIYGTPDEIKEHVYPQGKFYDVYESDLLGVKGELQFRYSDDGEDLIAAQFIVDSADFESYSEYQKAVNKTYRYFDRVLSRYQRWNKSDQDGIYVSWQRSSDNYAYSMYNTQTSDAGLTENLRDCTVFQFSKYIA